MFIKKLFILFTFIKLSLSWGTIGHRLILQIAAKHIDTDKLNKINDIIGGSFINIGDWADQVKHLPNYKWTEELHYINIENNKNLNYLTDCVCNKCIIGGINKFIWNLKNKKNMNDSIRFLAHLFADIHQPLHCGYKKDLGGNILTVKYDIEDNNNKKFHQVWDKSLINTHILLKYHTNTRDYLNDLYRLSLKYDMNECIDPMFIAEETIELLPHIYKDVYENCIIGPTYYYNNRNILDKQLAIAGKRLAILMNNYIS